MLGWSAGCACCIDGYQPLLTHALHIHCDGVFSITEYMVNAKVYSARGSRSESDTESASRGAFSRLTLTFTSLPSYFLLLPYDVVVTGEDHLNRRVMLLLPSSCELARAAAAHR